jgi:hypothetical protein
MPTIHVFNRLCGSLFETFLKELEFFVSMKKLHKRQFSLLVELDIFIPNFMSLCSVTLAPVFITGMIHNKGGYVEVKTQLVC